MIISSDAAGMDGSGSDEDRRNVITQGSRDYGSKRRRKQSESNQADRKEWQM